MRAGAKEINTAESGTAIGGDIILRADAVNAEGRKSSDAGSASRA